MSGFPNFTQALQVFGQKQVESAKMYLGGSGKGGSKLEQSLKYDVKGSFNEKPTVSFFMNEYGGFVDTGVTGTQNRTSQLNSKFANELFGFTSQPAFKTSSKSIPPSAIDKWVIKKGLEGTRDAKGRFISRSALKWLIAVSIHRKGLSHSGFFSIPLQKNLEDLTPALEGALKKDLQKNINPQKYFV
tara:strand:+ start:1772 stop:2332 length:561 start_codon:yes stop_codon:yes gene_type:complete